MKLVCEETVVLRPWALKTGEFGRMNQVDTGGKVNLVILSGSRDGTVVRALVSHQCSPDSASH